MNELMRSPAYRLYVKRVLREVKRHSEDAYIDRNIKNEIAERILDLTDGSTDEAAVKTALKQMEPARELGLRYRKFYKFSAERPDGFLLFERFFTNIAGIAILMITALCVYRMLPQVEYVAYAICALAGVAAAIFAHRAFYNIHFALATLYIPAFLLLYYPCKHSIADAVNGKGSFTELLFSHRYREIFITLIVMILAYTATTAILHAFSYMHKRGKIISVTASVILTIACVCGFAGYAYDLKDTYNTQAELQVSALRETYTNYQNGGPIGPVLVSAVKTMDLYEAYAGIYVPSIEQHSGSYFKLIDEFVYYDSGIDELIKLHNPAYDPTKRESPFAYETIEKKIADLKESVATLLASDPPEGEPFRLILMIEERCDLLHADLIATLKTCYNDWIYQ